MTEQEKIDNAINVMLDKELEKYNITHEDIERLPKNECGQKCVDGVFWQDYYTFEDEEEYNEFEKWCLDYLMTGPLKWNKGRAKHELAYFMVGLGLSVKHDDNISQI